MKKFILLTIVIMALIGLGLEQSSQKAGAGPSMVSVDGQVAPANANIGPLAAQATSTPVAPVDKTQSVVYRLPPSSDAAGVPRSTQSQERVVEQSIQDAAHLQGALERVRALRQAGKRFRVAGEPGLVATGLASSQSTSAATACMNMLLNPQMDVVEFPDDTGTADPWVAVTQLIWYSTVNYHSPSYSLSMKDDPVDDNSGIVSSTLEYDELGQGFVAPSALTAITVTHSWLYANANTGDTAYGNLYTLDSQGDLDQWVGWWEIDDSSSGWSTSSTTTTNSSILTALSGKPVALVFDMWNDRQAPYESIWLDDVQVTLCYAVGSQRVYLPVVIKQPPSALPTCTPIEPDTATQRGSTAISATCNGSFSATDVKDYYSVANPSNVANVRLCLRNLPSGSNWNATLWEDASGSYINPCNIGTVGDQNKCKDCTLGLGKSYFVVVGSGSGGTNTGTYAMSVESR
jgi:hypothetical protein